MLFPVKMEHYVQRRFFTTMVKLEGPRKMVARIALVDSRNTPGPDAPVTFPKVWKEAWENGDFIYFGGHSGSGVSLSLDNMLSNLTKDDVDSIRFQPNKTQIAFFDSCSSYAHYLDMYASRKHAGLHLMSYGLVSLFDISQPALGALLETVLGGTGDYLWSDVLKNMESSQLEPLMKMYYSKKEAKAEAARLRKKGQLPSLLLNVHIDD